MARELEIKIGADVDKAVRGLGDLGDAVDDVIKHLDRLADEGDGTAKSLADELRRSKSQYERAGREAGEAYSDGFKTTADDGFRRVGDSGAEAAGELRQNLGESLASFRGDLQDLPQLAQDTFAGLAGSGALGGIPGLFVTAAGAAGLGLLIAGMEQAKEKAEENEQAVKDWVDALIQGRGQIDLDEISRRIEELGTNTEALADAQKIVNATGLDEADVLRALAGDTEAAKRVTEEFADANDELNEKRKANRDAGKSSNDGLQEEIQTLLQGKTTWEGYTGQLDEARQKYDTIGEALGRSLAQYAETEAAAGRASSAVTAFGDTIVTLPDGKQIIIDADTGLATEDIATIESGDYVATVKTQADTTDADKQMDKFRQFVEGDAKVPKPKVKIDTSQAQRDWDAATFKEKTADLNLDVNKGAWNNWIPPSKTAIVYVKRQEI